MKKTIAIFLLILAIASFASADIYVKSKVHTDPMSMMGQNQPAKDSVSEQWIGDDKFAMISDQNSRSSTSRRTSCTSSTTRPRPTSRRPCRSTSRASFPPRWPR